MIAELLAKIGKPFLIAAACALILWGTYEKGYSNGNGAGLEAGFNKGVAAQKVETDTKQATINAMVIAENTRVKGLNDRIKELEDKSADLADALDKEKAKKEKVRTEIVKEYVEANPATQTACGWSEPTITVINKLAESVNENIPIQP